jgi:hypothetical protein
MSDTGMHETLRRLFDAILSEVGHNPALARKLTQAFANGQGVQAHPNRAKPARRGASASLQLHAVNILRLHGAAALRGKLEQIKAVEDLKSVATASGLVLSGSAARSRPSRAEVIDGIVEAAKHYDEQRNAATA